MSVPPAMILDMLYDDLVRALTEPGFTIDVRAGDLSGLSDEELGELLPAAQAVGAEAPVVMRQVAVTVCHAVREREPRFTPEACRRMFESLVARRGQVGPLPALDALRRCTGPWPELSGPARALTELYLEEDRVPHPYALLAVAGLAGDETLRTAADRLRSDAGAIVVDEIDVVIDLTPVERAVLAEADEVHTYAPEPNAPDVWRGIARIPAYVAFARRALEAAADRADALQRGELPYRADKAFTPREVDILGQAARVALLRDEPWLPDLVERLLPGIAVAPTAARTVPSQALLYELVRAARDFPTPELVTAIRTARSVTRHAGIPRQLDRLLKKVEPALAERTEVALRLSRDGFDDDGVLRREAGDGYTAVVTVTETVGLTWEKDGRPLKNVPAPVRRDHAGLLKELRGLVKRVDIQLGTLARALEGGFTVDAVHPYGWWRAELAGHPLARSVVRRLIWEIEVAPGRWRAVLPAAEDLPDAPDDASVRLWHPIRSDADTVRAWRGRLVDGQLRQPFKQAFREIYRLTPAEEETRVHSLRFAAHLVHYRRMFALFRARGWTSRLLGPWDAGDGDAALRTLGVGEWRASFAHTYADGVDGDEVASTDRVRFERRAAGAWREAPLAEVPPLVFSEAMRDVDLFVGVTSIAADPDWTEQGPARAYWERAAFAELSESAEARRDALARILPRLKIADRCTLDGRFLVVRGDLRTYRIHVGSANILMEPDNSYLCIVASRAGAGGKVFLPFEDDRLTVILSKALLLAADNEITDPSILTQIESGRPG
ncbi:DUF4132 domain-containing protein [Streptomyces sp. S3(2020)]|uniref:DUF4132 domain-containing protein n=1 Tax=Streptomyces sp. S3(2020) TaxID=2732044 RepID=UPI0014893818|nr:DUF4132 domain-containing protein [Streptomyces sp. S3(2020)]NNN32000.1 DUF4132 domain-containing protein [Streptomyces sp. S3(2020)]